MDRESEGLWEFQIFKFFLLWSQVSASVGPIDLGLLLHSLKLFEHVGPLLLIFKFDPSYKLWRHLGS